MKTSPFSYQYPTPLILSSHWYSWWYFWEEEEEEEEEEKKQNYAK